MNHLKKPFIIPIFIPHAGCPHHCIFCNQHAITGEEQNSLTPATLQKRILSFLKYNKHKRPVQIAFYGGNFLGQSIDKIRLLLEEAAKFVEHRKADSIRFSTRPDTVDENRLDIIQPYPVLTIELGVQSMDDRVLALSRRGHTAADTIQAVERLKNLNYEIGLQLMIGLPGDNDTSAIKSAHQTAGLKPDFVRIYPTVVLAGSPLANRFEQNKYTPLSLKAAVSLAKKLYLLFKTKNISVTRMGLQATEDFADCAVVKTGPYHPAFGHLVHSEIFLDKATALLNAAAHKPASMTFSVNPRSVSRLQGIGGHNLKILKQTFSLTDIRIVQDATLAEDDLVLS